MGKGRQQRRHLDRHGRAQLAGEPYIAPRPDAVQHALLVFRGRHQASPARAHAHPAGRAATTPAAHRGVRDARETAGFEHAGAAQYFDEAAIGIADANDATPALPGTANHAREQHGDGKGYEKPGEPFGDLVERRGSLRARPRHSGKGPSSPGRIGRRERRDVAAGLEDPEQRQDRHQHRNR
jgi:hypothetical protein